MTYYSCIVPPPPDDLPGTAWHSREAELSRGAFRTRTLAYFWAREHLEGYPYTIKEYTDEPESDCD